MPCFIYFELSFESEMGIFAIFSCGEVHVGERTQRKKKVKMFFTTHHASVVTQTSVLLMANLTGCHIH